MKAPKVNFIEEKWTMGELDEVDLEELARLVKEGYTSGHLDDGESKHIYWELRYNVWEDK